MSPTIRDVADLANVSFQLVSAVLAGKKYARASESTRKRIFESAEKLGYVPSVSARILKGGESKVLGVLVDSRAPSVVHSLLAEIEHVADLQGYRLLVAQAHDNPEKLLASFHSLKQYVVDCILSLAHDYPLLSGKLREKLLKEKNLVFVLNTEGEESCAVDVDIEEAMARAVKHLRTQQYRKAALLITRDEKKLEALSASCRKRVEGFRKCVPEGRILFVPDITLNEEAARKVCRRLAEKDLEKESIDCVIAQNDYMAALLMKELLQCGKKIPQEVGVIGWDNLFIGECTAVTLTTFHYDRKELAECAVQKLLSRIRGEEECGKICLKLKMTVRESTQRNSLTGQGKNKKRGVKK